MNHQETFIRGQETRPQENQSEEGKMCKKKQKKKD
jgi:hypothetical protein